MSTPLCLPCTLADHALNTATQLIKKRPLSPDVFDIDNKTPHYKFPWGAITSITNRATGVALSVGVW